MNGILLNTMLVEHLLKFLNGKYDTLEVRLHSINIKLNTVPAYYEAAKRTYKSNY
jgi:hypothetical protein